MAKILILIGSIVLLALVMTYSWFNRDSDRVILTLATAIMFGALGFITKESISNKTERSSQELSIVTFYGLPEYRPLNINLPYYSDLLTCVQNIDNKDLPTIKSGSVLDISYASDKYFDALQYSIIKIIFKQYSKGWNVTTKESLTPTGRTISWQSHPDKGDAIPIDDIFNQFKDNYFLTNKLLQPLPAVFGGVAVFPKGTVVKINHGDYRNEFELELSNRYVTLNIKLRYSGSSMGIGEYYRLLGLPEGSTISSEIGNSVYYLSMNVEQTYLLNGHPEMKKHRNWADSIVKLLNNKYNYETIRSDHMRDFQLHGPKAIKAFQF